MAGNLLRNVPDDLVKYILKKSPDEYKDVNPDTIKNKPNIIVRTKPAELIETIGEPEPVPITGTSLLFIKYVE